MLPVASRARQSPPGYPGAWRSSPSAQAADLPGPWPTAHRSLSPSSSGCESVSTTGRRFQMRILKRGRRGFKKNQQGAATKPKSWASLEPCGTFLLSASAGSWAAGGGSGIAGSGLAAVGLAGAGLFASSSLSSPARLAFFFFSFRFWFLDLGCGGLQKGPNVDQLQVKVAKPRRHTRTEKKTAAPHN